MPRRRLKKAERAELYLRFEGKCASCGSKDRLEIDHVLPLALGGKDEPSNMTLLCFVCHRSAGAKTSKDVQMIAKADRQKKKHETGRGRSRKGRTLRAGKIAQWRSMSGKIKRKKNDQEDL